MPRKEDYGLTSQLRRASNSITANIAEGFGRTSTGEKNKFYEYAKGSAYETKSHLFYGKAVKYFNEDEVIEIIKEIDNVIFELNKLKKSIKN